MSSRYAYIGCYKDKLSAPALPQNPFDSKQVSVDQCLEEAARKNIRFAGLEGADLNDDRSTGICRFSNGDTFNNYGPSNKCERLIGGQEIGRGSNLAIYELITNDTSSYNPINQLRWTQSPIEISTKDGWSSSLKLVSNGTDVFFGVPQNGTTLITTWKAIITDDNKMIIESSTGRAIINDNGRIRLMEHTGEPLKFDYNPTDGTLTVGKDILQMSPTIPATIVPPMRELELVERTSNSPTDYQVWIVPGVPNGNPPLPTPPPPVPVPSPWDWSVFIWLFIIAGVILLMIVILAMFWWSRRQPKTSVGCQSSTQQPVSGSGLNAPQYYTQPSTSYMQPMVTSTTLVRDPASYAVGGGPTYYQQPMYGSQVNTVQVGPSQGGIQGEVQQPQYFY